MRTEVTVKIKEMYIDEQEAWVLYISWLNMCISRWYTFLDNFYFIIKCSLKISIYVIKDTCLCLLFQKKF